MTSAWLICQEDYCLFTPSYFNGYYHGNLSRFNLLFSDLTEDDDDVQIVSKHK